VVLLRKMKKISLIIAMMMVLSSFGIVLGGCGGAEEQAEDTMYSDFLSRVDTGYAYDLAVELSESEDLADSAMGTRTSGSDAEHRTAERLQAEMESIGLTDVQMYEADVDKWQFNGASVKLDEGDTEIQLHSYATAATPEEGIDAEIVYVGEGTAADYEGIDISGKIALFDVNQRDNWWVTYPMLEAEHQGAIAALACSNEGFSEISDDAYNANDICGPISIPTTSITVKDAQVIKDKIEEGNEVTAHLEVNNVVEEGGTTYNVVGKIEGKSPGDEMVAFGAHYDKYFSGFQDNCCAVGASFAIAKAMIEAGYEPENDIIFIMHGAEEWGASGTQYDWTTGAWRQIFEIKPEWQGKIRAFINFELPAYEFADYTSVYSVPELYTMIDKFVNDEPSPKPEGVFKDGIKTEGYQSYTYSDDFSYYTAGVPSTVNGFLLQEDMETVFDFYKNYYHTDYDNKDTYNDDVMKFTIDFYGAFGIYIDKQPALELDYTNQYDILKASLDEDIAKEAGADYDEFMSAVEEYGKAAEAAYEKTKDINDRYWEAVAGDASADELGAIREEGKAANELTLGIFKTTVDELLGLIYETPIVPHQSPQESIDLINQTVAFLEDGDVVSAVDETAWQINGVNEWYAMFFSPEVTDQFYDMFYSVNNEDNQFWGTKKQFVWANVEEATRSITDKYEETNPDLSKEIAIYKKALDEQKPELVKLVKQEIKSIYGLSERLNEYAAG